MTDSPVDPLEVSSVGESFQGLVGEWMQSQMQPEQPTASQEPTADTWGILAEALTTDQLHEIAQLRGIKDEVFYADGGPEHFRLTLGIGTVVCGDCLKLDCTGHGR